MISSYYGKYFQKKQEKNAAFKKEISDFKFIPILDASLLLETSISKLMNLTPFLMDLNANSVPIDFLLENAP